MKTEDARKAPEHFAVVLQELFELSPGHLVLGRRAPRRALLLPPVDRIRVVGYRLVGADLHALGGQEPPGAGIAAAQPVHDAVERRFVADVQLGPVPHPVQPARVRHRAALQQAALLIARVLRTRCFFRTIFSREGGGRDVRKNREIISITLRKIIFFL